MLTDHFFVLQRMRPVIYFNPIALPKTKHYVYVTLPLNAIALEIAKFLILCLPVDLFGIAMWYTQSSPQGIPSYECSYHPFG